MQRQLVREMLSSVSGNSPVKIQYGFPMNSWRVSDDSPIDGRVIHQWILDHLDLGETFNSHDGSMSLEHHGHDVLGHYECGKGIWVFTFGRIQFFRKPRAFARVGWKDLTRDKIGNKFSQGLQDHEGEDYLAVFPTLESQDPVWVKICGPINTDGLPTHLPMALRFFQSKITRWIRRFDSLELMEAMSPYEFYGEKLGDVNWLSSVFEESSKNNSFFKNAFFTKFETSSYDVLSMRELWEKFQSIAGEGRGSIDRSNAEIVSHYRELVDFGRRLFSQRKKTTRRAYPIVRTDSPVNIDHFFIDEEMSVVKTVVMADKYPVTTAPLAASMEHDLIGISTLENAITGGDQNYVDSLGVNIRISTAYYRDCENSRTLRTLKFIDPNIDGFVKSPEGNGRELVLNHRFTLNLDGEIVEGSHSGVVNLEMGNVWVTGSNITCGGRQYEFVGYDLDFERV